MQFFFPILDKIGAPILVGLFFLLFIMETSFQLRHRTMPRFKRVFTNAGVAAVAFIFLRFALIPVLVFLSGWANYHEFGLLNWINLPEWADIILAFLLLDYLNYIWHLLNHEIPLLWRFHNVHHTDPDLDVTTAIRFHFGEIFASIFFRGAAIVLTGAPPILVLVYEIMFEAATNFHHTNWKLPYPFERFLSWIIVTPRMHGIHHSIVKRETDSNFSVIFSLWDRIHRTIRLNIHQKDLTIGVPSYMDPDEQKVKNLLLMPFRKQREWKMPDGTIPERNGNGDIDYMKK